MPDPSAPRSPEDIERLAAEWLGHAARGSSYSDGDWASGPLDDLVADEPDLALPLILALLRLAPSKAVRSCVAAGPLEDLLVTHGGSLIGRIEDAAGDDRFLREAIAGVWLDQDDAGEWGARGDPDPMGTLQRYRALGVIEPGRSSS